VLLLVLLQLLMLTSLLQGCDCGHCADCIGEMKALVSEKIFEVATVDAKPEHLSENFQALASTLSCGKMKVLKALLKEWTYEECRKRHKVLLFSRSAKMLDILQCMIETEGYDFLRLDGGTKQADRPTMCDAFNTDQTTFIFLISTKAGGLGLNLASADKVVVFDPDWNPSFDLQAQVTKKT